MKKMKRLVAVLLAGVMALTMLTACGGGGGGGSTTTEKEIAEAFAKATGITLIESDEYEKATNKYIDQISQDPAGYYETFTAYMTAYAKYLEEYNNYLENLQPGEPINPPQFTPPENKYSQLLLDVLSTFASDKALGFVTIGDGSLSAADLISNLEDVTPPSLDEDQKAASAYIRVNHVSNSSSSAWVIFMVMPVTTGESGE